MTTCPQCGFKENVSTKLQSNVMNVYVNDETDKVFGVMNSEEEYLNIPANKAAGTLAVKVRRQDIPNPKTQAKTATPTVTPPVKK